jgi:hypothetical protein
MLVGLFYGVTQVVSTGDVGLFQPYRRAQGTVAGASHQIVVVGIREAVLGG